MRFRVPFTYFAQYQQAGRRRFDAALLRSYLEMEIAEEAAPGEPSHVLGFRPLYDWGQTPSRWEPFAYKVDQPVRVWRLDGQCYVEFCDAVEFVSSVQHQANNPFDVVLDGKSALPNEVTVARPTTHEEVVADRMVRRWVDDGGAAKSDLIVRRASDMRVIDGVVCVAVTEPVLVVRVMRGAVHVAIEEDTGVPRPRDDLGADRRFRIDRMRDASACATAIASRTGRVFSPEANVLKATLGRPWLNQEGEHLYQNALILMTMLDRVDQLKPEVDSTAQDLISALEETPEGHATGALADAVEQLILALRRLGASPDHSGALKDGMRSLRDLDEVELELPASVGDEVATWRSRSVDADDWSEKAIRPAAACSAGVEQILSGRMLSDFATRLRVSREQLLQEHNAGNLLLGWRPVATSVPSEPPRVAVVSPDLEVLRCFGSSGRQASVNEPLQSVLEEARRRRDDLVSLASIGL